MEDRTDCKWMEYFENYDEKEKYLCHFDVDSKYVNMNEVCMKCPHYEKSNDK